MQQDLKALYLSHKTIRAWLLSTVNYVSFHDLTHIPLFLGQYVYNRKKREILKLLIKMLKCRDTYHDRDCLLIIMANAEEKASKYIKKCI